MRKEKPLVGQRVIDYFNPICFGPVHNYGTRVLHVFYALFV